MPTIKSFDGEEFDAYMALPASGYGPGIVVLQEIFGVNEYMRSVCDWYASHGFVAICPDLFWRQEPGIQLTDRSEAEWQRAFALYQGLDEVKAVEDSAAAVEFLRKHPACSGRVGAVGFCLGGNLAWLLSVRFKPDCAVGYYSVSIEKTLGEADGLSSPLMLHIGGKDQYCPPDAQKEIHAALDSNPLATIHDYPDQDHAFGRPGGKHYDAKRLSWRTCARWNSLLGTSRAPDWRLPRNPSLIVGMNTSSMNSPRATPKILWKLWSRTLMSITFR